MPLPPRTDVKTFNPEIERLLYQVQVIVEESEGLVDGVSETQFNWSPQPGAWSMAQCLDHLNVTLKQYLAILEPAIANARKTGLLSEGPFVYGFLSRMILKMSLPPVKRRFSAPKIFAPGPRKTMEGVLSEWKTLHERLKKAMESASGIDLKRVKVSSPVSSLIKLSLGMAFWIITAHEKRHLWQARNVRNAKGFPAA